MATLEVLKFPDKKLRVQAVPVDSITREIKKLAVNMMETMYANKGIGLAATQVGVPLRIIVLDIEQLEDNPNPIVVLNPEIIYFEGKEKADEG